MTTITHADYLRLMTPWLQALPRLINTCPADPSVRFYGTGEHAHWPVQSNLNVVAALAVLADAPGLEAFPPAMTRDEIRATALACFRYAIGTHRSSKRLPATDGGYWGGHWISVLGLERAAHGIQALEPHLTDDDRAGYQRLRLDEAAAILTDFEITAGTSAEGRNHPESNIWNGAFLLRLARDCPDAPDAPVWIEKATQAFVAGISIPADAHSNQIHNGRRVRDRHVGANFTENFSLDHHGYMNVGYSIICLSNIAMAFYALRERGQAVPDALFHNAEDLWKTLRNFIFPDGRLLRIGGDTRARYTYCQCYAIPMFLLAADRFGDPSAVTMEKRWLRQVRAEMAYTGDGTCYTRRLAPLFRMSRFYGLRLESDHILSLSYGAYWRRKFDIPGSAPTRKPRPFSWQDDFHGAVCLRTARTVRSWVRAGGQGPTGLCVPLCKSDMAEWQGNLNGYAEGNLAEAGDSKAAITRFDNGFIAVCHSTIVEAAPIGEGEGRYPVVRLQTAAAALPDGRSMIVIQHGHVIKDAMLCRAYSLNLLLPNDVFNKFRRTLATAPSTVLLTGTHHKAEVFDTESNHITIDDTLALFSLTPGKTIKIVREEEQNIRLRRGFPIPTSLYAERFCLTVNNTPSLHRVGDVLFDDAFAIAADVDTTAMEACPGGTVETSEEGVRQASFTAFDGHRYLLLANFRSTHATAPHATATDLVSQETREHTPLAPGAACLLRLQPKESQQ